MIPMPLSFDVPLVPAMDVGLVAGAGVLWVLALVCVLALVRAADM